MSDTPEVRVEFDASKLIAKFNSRKKAAQAYLDEAVMKDTDRYVRYRSGTLARSVQTATHIGTGRVIYDTPYAHKVYYDTASYVTKDVHPYAQALWFEESKKRNLASWRKGVERILKDGNSG